MTAALRERYAGWALVTGSARASGLGYTFARQLAEQGFNLVLVDILADDLTQRAAELRQKYSIEVRTAVVDLSQPDFMPQLEAYIRDIPIGLLVCNHMYTPADTPKILDMDLATHHRMMDINARAYTTLVHTFGRQMRDRRQGAIIMVASGAGLVPAPYTGAYSANKAFQIALGEALWYELKDSGVDVLVIVAGLMNTQGDALSQYPQFMVSQTDPVVREALHHLGKQHLVIPGFVNKVFMFMQMKLMSRQRAVNIVGNFMKNGLGKT
ncbi:MAG: SDR family NAD(P)-dependent oxidoreductase [Chloroflexota bacterium]